jgi:ASC-1-like (ASCH) protein
MLLFVRNPYWQAIVEGRKRFEIRAGSRYRNLRPGAWLSINGKLRVRLIGVTRLESSAAAERLSIASGYRVSVEQLHACYPLGGPYYFLHF